MALQMDDKNVVQKDNLTDLASTLPATPAPSQSAPAENTPPPANLGDNQVVAPNGDVVDLGINSENITTK